MTDALWYLARGAGIVTLVLLSVSVALGVCARSRRPFLGLPRFALARVHRDVSLFAVVTLTVHVVSLLFDPYAQLELIDLAVPFTSTYRPLWVGLGALSLDLLLALVVTSLLRERVGLRLWRAVHWGAYALWPTAVLHTLGSGSDAGTWWLRLVQLGCLALVLAAVGWRLSFPSSAATRVVARPMEVAR